MPLDKNRLQQAIETAFESAKQEGWETAQVASALADAIDAYVRGAEVVGVTTTVRVTQEGTGIVSTGNGTQSGTARVQ